MVATCLQVVGFVTSFVGWIGIIVTTSTNDWVVTCSYTIPTCRKMDELGSKGLWADCVMATGLYHCKPLVDILILPGKNPELASSFQGQAGPGMGALDRVLRSLRTQRPLGTFLTSPIPPCRRISPKEPPVALSFFFFFFSIWNMG